MERARKEQGNAITFGTEQCAGHHLENARIYTMDHDLPHAQAIAWRDGRI